ncbi:DUF397 domain-containing protein [Dactylosporangium sp. CA-139066]|uniref:DUF397 domain-containing protein n=1 Tax=Dactylosporangium sp. CA-139066 TaxID=3239930 RepID=UPI003D900A3C
MSDGAIASAWRSSSKCDSSTCVQVSIRADHVGVRDGADPDGAVLWFTADAWRAFVAGVGGLGSAAADSDAGVGM